MGVLLDLSANFCLRWLYCGTPHCVASRMGIQGVCFPIWGLFYGMNIYTLHALITDAAETFPRHPPRSQDFVVFTQPLYQT